MATVAIMEHWSSDVESFFVIPHKFEIRPWTRDSNTRPAGAFCAARDAFREFSNN